MTSRFLAKYCCYSTPSPCAQILVLVLPSEVPATSLSSLGKAAKAELGEFGEKRAPKNAARSAHSFVARWGLTWKVPLSEFKFIDQNQEEVTITYISPVSFVRFLLMHAPELLMGGVIAQNEGSRHLEDFWRNYRHSHPTHRLFQENHPVRRPANTIPACFHGDEGRGKEKGNTVVMMFEACLGVGTAENIRHKRRNDQCNDCYLRDSCAKRFKTTEGNMTVACDARPVPLSACQAHNTKNNSYLTKFVLSVLPNDFYKFGNALEVVLTKICEDFRYLFEEGVSVHNKTWFLGLTGLKGDLKWYEKIANLHRCFNKQCGAGLQMCHECEAGTPQYPWEDGSHHPVWGNVLYQSRPWNQTPIIVNIPFEPPGGAPEKILRRDLFHNTKVGLLRDFVASSILLLIFLGYFKDGRPGVSNKIDVCLERAHRSFYLFCRTTQSKAGLRSFTPTFLNYKKSTCYGWINAKGSDVTLLIKWLCVWVGGLLNDPLDPEHVPTLRRIYLGAMCVKTWQNILYSHGCWLHRHCGMVVYQEFHEFLQHYNWLAFICLTKWHFTGYGMKSKFHMIAHAKLDLANLLDQTDIQWVPSPLLFSSEMNEDVVGKLARLSRRADSRLNTKRTLQLYLCKAKAAHSRFRKSIAENKND